MKLSQCSWYGLHGLNWTDSEVTDSENWWQLVICSARNDSRRIQNNKVWIRSQHQKAPWHQSIKEELSLSQSYALLSPLKIADVFFWTLYIYIYYMLVNLQEQQPAQQAASRKPQANTKMVMGGSHGHRVPRLFGRERPVHATLGGRKGNLDRPWLYWK